MRHTFVNRLGILSLVGMLAAGVGCSAGDTEMAFCDAVNRNDAAAAKAIFDAGQIDMMARDFSGKCQPGALLLHAARPQSPAVFTAMAVAFVKREGVANTCWTGGKGNSIGGCAISFAALNANVEVMRALVDAGVNVTNQTARGAVDDAANQGSAGIVRMLVEKGANAASGAPREGRHTAIVEYPGEQGRHRGGRAVACRRAPRRPEGRGCGHCRPGRPRSHRRAGPHADHPRGAVQDTRRWWRGWPRPARS